MSITVLQAHRSMKAAIPFNPDILSQDDRIILRDALIAELEKTYSRNVSVEFVSPDELPLGFRCVTFSIGETRAAIVEVDPQSRVANTPQGATQGFAQLLGRFSRDLNTPVSLSLESSAPGR